MRYIHVDTVCFQIPSVPALTESYLWPAPISALGHVLRCRRLSDDSSILYISLVAKVLGGGSCIDSEAL